MKKILLLFFLFLLLFLYSGRFQNQALADAQGTRKVGEKCNDKGNDSCTPDLDCAGFDDNAGSPFNTLGVCVAKVDNGGQCLPKADAIRTTSGLHAYGECKSGFFCDGATILPGGNAGSPGNCRPHKGTKLIGERCESKGKDSCKSDLDPNKALDCAGFNDVPGPFNTLGTCVAKVDPGGECLPQADCTGGKCYGECKDNLLCKDAATVPFKHPGKCEVPPPPDPEDPPPPPPPLPPCTEWAPGNKLCLSLDTGLGNIKANPGEFIRTIFGIILAFSGAIALLLIIRAGYKIMTSEGNPEKVKEGRDQLIAAIVGLLFLIFSFVLLQAIGVDILKIPGLEK